MAISIFLFNLFMHFLRWNALRFAKSKDKDSFGTSAYAEAQQNNSKHQTKTWFQMQ